MSKATQSTDLGFTSRCMILSSSLRNCKPLTIFEKRFMDRYATSDTTRHFRAADSPQTRYGRGLLRGNLFSWQTPSCRTFLPKTKRNVVVFWGFEKTFKQESFEKTSFTLEKDLGRVTQGDVHDFHTDPQISLGEKNQKIFYPLLYGRKSGAKYLSE